MNHIKWFNEIFRICCVQRQRLKNLICDAADIWTHSQSATFCPSCMVQLPFTRWLTSLYVSIASALCQPTVVILTSAEASISSLETGRCDAAFHTRSKTTWYCYEQIAITLHKEVLPSSRSDDVSH